MSRAGNPNDGRQREPDRAESSAPPPSSAKPCGGGSTEHETPGGYCPGLNPGRQGTDNSDPPPGGPEGIAEGNTEPRRGSHIVSAGVQAGATPSEPPNEQRKTELDRIIFFSDAVFAIALTLLALGIKVPDIPSNQAASQLTHKLFGLLPQVLTFTLSFFVIASFWMTHHQRFRYIEDYDGNLMRLNLIHLFFIVLLPFPTEVVSQYGSTSQGVILYALAVGACSLTSYALWWYATEDRRLVIPSLDDAEVKRTRIQSLTSVFIFFGSIIIAVFNPTAALLSWISLWIVARITSRRFYDRIPELMRRRRA